MFRTGILTFLAYLLLAVSAGLAQAQQPAVTPPPDRLVELMRIIDDPAMHAWIEAQAKAGAKPSTPAATSSGIRTWESRARSNFRAILSALPSLPGEIASAAGRIRNESSERGFMPVAVILALVLGASVLGEWATRKVMQRVKNDHPILARTYAELVPLAVFTLIAAVAFLSVEWPPLLHAVILFYLLAAIGVRLVAAVCVMALAAGSLTPFMFRRILLFSGVLFLGLASSAVASELSIPDAANYGWLFVISVMLLAISCEAVWRQSADGRSVRSKILQTLCLILLWVLWSGGFHILFWIGIYAAVLPRLLPAVDRLTRAFVATRWPEDPDFSIPTVLVVRGVRAIIVAAAVAWLALVWQYNPRSPGHEDSLLGLVILGLIKSVIVLLIADLGWSLAKTAINRKLASVAADAPLQPEEMARRARVRTLLPIFRNGLAALVLAIAGLTVLAEMGVQIAPLIAGAGVFGVAIGFGSQTLVKDVVSGVFYLMDDAFRVGEYIQSGSYKGTVESFSLRSVRLRHHRGPVFTVPFGELGAVQNMSRDWAIDKFLLRVDFDTDVAKAKKLVKVIGTALLEDEELGPLIIETLKMKGVEQIGEYGIDLAFAFTAVPGYQSTIRRRAYVMIRQAFKENGIGFAQPTVQVGGDDKSDAAAAAHALAAHEKRVAAEQAAME